MSLDGVGVTVTPHSYKGLFVPGLPRPDIGPDMVQVICDRCHATWVGQAGDPCWWCAQHLRLMREGQARLVLEAPDVDPDDARYVAVMKGWQARLQRAVKAELITAPQAEQAWERATRRTAA